MQGIVAYEVMLGRTPFQMLGVADHQELVFKELRCRDDMEDLIVPYMGDGRNGGEVAERWGNFYNFIKACLKICPWNRPSAQDAGAVYPQPGSGPAGHTSGVWVRQPFGCDGLAIPWVMCKVLEPLFRHSSPVELPL